MLQEIQILIQQRIDAQVNSAVTSYKAAHPEKSDAEIEEFRRVALTNVSSSAAKIKLMNSKSLRNARKELAKQILKGSKFITLHIEYLEPVASAVKKIEQMADLPMVKHIDSLLHSVHAKVPNFKDYALRRVPMVQRSMAVAFKYDYSAEDGIDLLLAFTFLNPSDTPDELIAAETLAERVRAGQILRVKARPENFIDGIQDRVEALAEVYRTEFLMDTSGRPVQS
ncbi:hypothetical protein D3C87_279710 [compost metagenome]